MATTLSNPSVLEASRLRERASAFASSQRWAVVSAALLVPSLVLLPFPHVVTVVDLIVLVASVAAWVQYRTVPPTTLSKRQLQLLGLDEHNVQMTASSTSIASSNTPSSNTAVRQRIATVGPSQPTAAAISTTTSPLSPLPFSRHAVSPAPGASPHLERRNFDLGRGAQRSYAEAAWREIADAAEAKAGGDMLPHAATLAAAAAAQGAGHGAYTGLFGSSFSSSSSSSSSSDRPARVVHAYNTSPPPATGSGASLAHLLSPSLPYHPTRTVATTKALAALNLREVSDGWVDRLRLVRPMPRVGTAFPPLSPPHCRRQILGKHLRKALHRFDASVARAVHAVKADPAADALRTLLELRTERVGAQGVADAVVYVRQLGQVRAR